MNIANRLTFTRILLSPLFVLLYLYYKQLGLSLLSMSVILLILVALSELTDFFDGFLARKTGKVTELGKVFDPLADSVSRLSLFLCFTRPPVEVPLIFVFLLIFRDSLISCLRTICALENFTLAARPSGKIKAAIQATAIFLTLGALLLYALNRLSLTAMQQTATWASAIAAAYTILSLIEYLFANQKFIKRALKK